MVDKNILHVIYVRGSDADNLITGLSKGIWGFRDDSSKKIRDDMDKIKENNLILFAFNLSGQSVRKKFSGQLSQYILCRATSNKYEVNEAQDSQNLKIWEDEDSKNIYLHRFSLKILSSYPKLVTHDESFILSNEKILINDSNTSKKLEKLYEGFRLSTCRGCRNIPLDKVKFDEANLSKDDLLENMELYFDLTDCPLFVKPETIETIKGKYSNKKPSKNLLNFEKKIEKEEGLLSDLKNILDSCDNATEKERLIQARVGQGKYRKAILKNFNNRCLLTGIAHPSLLVASHIKAWSKCDNKQEKLDPLNGLLLSSLVDKLFDKYFISFHPEDLRLVVCNDPLIQQIIDEMDISEYFLDLSMIYKNDQDITKVKEYLNSHFLSFKALNEKI